MNRHEIEQKAEEIGDKAAKGLWGHMQAHPKGYLVALALIVAFALGAYWF